MEQLQAILKEHQRGPQIKPGTYKGNVPEGKTGEQVPEENASENDQAADGTGA